MSTIYFLSLYIKLLSSIQCYSRNEANKEMRKSKLLKSCYSVTCLENQKFMKMWLLLADVRFIFFKGYIAPVYVHCNSK